MEIDDETVMADLAVQSTDPTEPGSAPRIYYLSPLLAGPIAGWDVQFKRIASLGFDHVLIAPPFKTGPSGDLFLPADYGRLDARLGHEGDADSALRHVTAAARSAGLTMLLDVVLDLAAAASPLALDHAALFETADEDAALDPRGRLGNFESARLRGDAFGVTEWWAARLASWVRAGIGGFRFLRPGALPAPVMRGIVAGLRRQGTDALLLAPAQGVALDDLRGAGFDYLIGSLPDWDFRSEWFWDELTALSRIAPVIAAPEAPFGPRLMRACHDPALVRPTYDRNLGLAVTIASGWMMPMGFEFAAGRRMDPAYDTPEDFSAIERQAPFDLSAAVGKFNRLRPGEPALSRAEPPAVLAGAGASCLAVLRRGGQGRATLILANADPARRRACAVSTLVQSAGGGFTHFEPLTAPADGERRPLDPGVTLQLDPGEVALYAARETSAPAVVRPKLEESAGAAVKAPRLAIEAVTPQVEQGLFPAKRLVGEMVTVEADVIADGHDVLGAALLWRQAGDRSTRDDAWREARMRPLGNDRWQAVFPLPAIGTYQFTVEAWRDAFGTFRDELAKKHVAGVDTRLEVQEGALLIARIADAARPAVAPRIVALRASVAEADAAAQRTLLLAPETAALMAEADPRWFGVRYDPPLVVQAERTAARFANWYEVFPRSLSDDPHRHGTFRDVMRHLPRIRDMGFDVLYFPPIHPIGRVNRKGRNNSLTPAEDDPGSPYAIGSAEGGLEAVHPELGTLDDFRALRAAAAAEGIELALDFAIQVSPDHPWLRQHKDWFEWRPDGSLRYAENPPKKYEDITNVDFYADGAKPALWVALCEAVLFWAEQGVRLFRVDNPHTKPFPFWEWLIGEVRARYPDAIFLAEAFTRPKVMYRLAKVGFSQSYTYFTWRNTKRELTEYVTELTADAPREFFRPHFFVNTPDINPIFLQNSGRAGFLIRAALAATLSGLWGVYNGFELCEAEALPGREEYANSEKYQLRAWDWDRPGNIVNEITQLNRMRRTNPALQTHLNTRFHNASNDTILYFSKATDDRSNVLLVAVSLDPHNAQEAEIEAPLWDWGLPDSASLDIEDLLRGTREVWTGKTQRVRLDPAAPYAIWRARPAG